MFVYAGSALVSVPGLVIGVMIAIVCVVLVASAVLWVQRRRRRLRGFSRVPTSLSTWDEDETELYNLE